MKIMKMIKPTIIVQIEIRVITINIVLVRDVWINDRHEEIGKAGDYEAVVFHFYIGSGFS